MCIIDLYLNVGGAGLSVAPDGVHLLYDYKGRASGEAFVHFIDKGSAQEALNRDREKIGHRWGASYFTLPSLQPIFGY